MIVRVKVFPREVVIKKKKKKSLSEKLMGVVKLDT